MDRRNLVTGAPDLSSRTKFSGEELQTPIATGRALL